MISRVLQEAGRLSFMMQSVCMAASGWLAVWLARLDYLSLSDRRGEREPLRTCSCSLNLLMPRDRNGKGQYTAPR